MQKLSSDKDGEQTEKDATAAEKKKLLRQIRELNSIIEQCEWSLETLRFKDVEERLSEPANLNVPSTVKNLPNVDADLQNDLYRFAGLNCISVQRNEVTFNFASNDQQAKNKYAVQLFVKDEKAHLGKWVMPMSIDMNEILTNVPIDSLKNLTPFVRTCKHYIDCFTVRQDQFLSLKKHISSVQHCDLQSNTGYTIISLELCGVHDRENDKYINIILYLQYHPDRTRPHKIEVETNDKPVLNDDVKQRLKVCFKEFKLSDLSTAFDKVLANDSEFTWMRTDDSDSPLELHYSSDSDEEGFLEQLQSERRKSLRQAKKKQELKKKWNERKRQRYTASKIAASEDDDSEANEPHTKRKMLRSRKKSKEASKDNDSEANGSHTENSSENLRRGKKRKEASKDDSGANISRTENLRESLRGKKKGVSILKQNIGKNLLENGTPKVKSKLKQVKLNFQVNSIASSACAENSDLSNKLDNKTKLITSTPLSHGRTNKMTDLEAINITDIKKPKQTTNPTSRVLRNQSTQKKKAPRKSPRLAQLFSKSVHSS